MRNKKIFVTLLLMTTVMSFTCGCGRQAEPVYEELMGTVEEADTEESTGKSIEENAKPTPSPAAALKESTESSEAEDNSEREVDATEEPVSNENPVATEKPVSNENPVATEKPVSNENPVVTEKPAQTEKPAATETPAATEEPAAAEKPVQSEPVQSDNSSAPAPIPTPVPTPAPTPVPQPVHEHNWIAHTDQRWVPQIVTVVDEPEQYESYTIYEMYWYNTGTWEETRDPDRFREWSQNSEGGALYPIYHIEKNEDNPLFLGYNELGQPSFTGDHVLRTGYDLIPAVTHEEDQGYYETYVDYYYCDCGATK